MLVSIIIIKRRILLIMVRTRIVIVMIVRIIIIVKILEMGVSQKGYLIGGPHNKD